MVLLDWLGSVRPLFMCFFLIPFGKSLQTVGFELKKAVNLSKQKHPLKRTGYNTTTCLYKTVDSLTFNYPSSSNRLSSITDHALLANKNFGFDPGLGGLGYSYDNNGNLKTDTYKGITNISYNHLNLPSKIDWGTTKSIEFVYDASGTKLSKKVKTGSTVNYIQDYVGGIEYNSPSGINRKIESIFHAEGNVLLDFLNSNKKNVDIVYSDGYSMASESGSQILWNPEENIIINKSRGGGEISSTTILGHEFGHSWLAQFSPIMNEGLEKADRKDADSRSEHTWILKNVENAFSKSRGEGIRREYIGVKNVMDLDVKKYKKTDYRILKPFTF